MTENVIAALEIMGIGMLSLFAVMIILALSVVLLHKLDDLDEDKKGKKEN